MLAIRSCSIRNGLCTNDPGEVARLTLKIAPSQVVYAPLLLGTVQSPFLEPAFTWVMYVFACVMSWLTRACAVVYADLAAVSDPWQLVAVQERKVCTLISHVWLTVGCPFASTHGAA